MRCASIPSTFLLLLPALLLAACGGGGSLDATPTSSKATLTGEILSIDGDTSALDGVVLALVETGQLVESSSDGWFSFGDVPTGTLTLELVSAASYSAKAGDASTLAEDDDATDEDDDLDEEDDVDDDNDLDEDGMCMERVRSQERLHVRIRIQDGQLGEMQCTRSENTERETERHMERTEANGDPDMEGELEMEQRQDRERFRVEVEHAEPGTDLECVVIAPDGTEESLGLRTVQGDGECEWNIDTSNGGRLPFGAGSVEDLEGYRVQVRRRATNQAMLEGDVPDLPPRDQTRTEEQNQERAEDSDGEHDRDQDRDRDGSYGDDA